MLRTKGGVQGRSQYLQYGLVVDLHILTGHPVILTAHFPVIVGRHGRRTIVRVTSGHLQASAVDRFLALPLAVSGPRLPAISNSLLDSSNTLDFIQELIQTGLSGSMNIWIVAAEELE